MPDDRTSRETFLSLVNCASKEEFLDRVRAYLGRHSGFTAATLNLDHIVKLRADPAFREAYRNHSLVVADGRPVIWLRKVMGEPVGLVPGSEMVAPLCAVAADLGVSVAFFGSTPETLDKAATALESAHPGLRVVSRISPPFGFDPGGDAAAEAIEQMAGSGAGLCLLALGAPKQEILAVRAARICPAIGFVSIGAGLDFIAGTQTRAPAWARRIAMEWFWRMATDPRRLFRRYARCLVALPGLFVRAYRDRRAAAGG
jgi:exopolysaccharide biosynthesis WecB/TagA/CpsF family protein